MFVLDLPNETRLLSSDDDRLLLTTHRVRFEAKSAAFRRVTSILLEEVSACEIASTSKPWLFTLALLFVLLGLLGLEGPHTNDAKLSFLIALFFGLAYLATRRQVISVRSSGGSINVPTRGMGLERAMDFIDQVELAKYRNARK
jgi:hypothetical protein